MNGDSEKKKQRNNQGLPSVSENCPKHKRVANKGCCEDLDPWKGFRIKLWWKILSTSYSRSDGRGNCDKEKVEVVQSQLVK